MRVLIVEDNPDKLRALAACIKAVPGIAADSLDHVSDAASAKRQLHVQKYDLLVLDIAIPDRLDLAASKDGGIRLLKELTERPGYRLPDHIVGLTGYPELHEPAQESFGAKSWRVIRYEENSDAWFQELSARVAHIVASRRIADQETHAFQSHLAVVCALDTPELSSVLRLDWKWQIAALARDPTIYHRGTIEREGQLLAVHAAAASRMGMTATAILATRMILAFRPRYLAMVGIAAGIPGRTHPGDIVAADPTWDYSSGKVESTKDGQPRLLISPHQISLSPSVRNQIRQMSSDAVTLARIAEGWVGKAAGYPLRLHIGPLASGPSVLADDSKRDEILSQHRKLLAIEMEAYGLYAAADDATEPRPQAFALKSVCDFGDAAKKNDHQHYAAYTSARALQELMERYL